MPTWDEIILKNLEILIILLEALQLSINRLSFLKKSYEELLIELKEKYTELAIATDKEVPEISDKLYKKLNETFQY